VERKSILVKEYKIQTTKKKSPFFIRRGLFQKIEGGENERFTQKTEISRR